MTYYLTFFFLSITCATRISENRYVKFLLRLIYLFITVFSFLTYIVNYQNSFLYADDYQDEDIAKKTKQLEFAREGIFYFPKKSIQIQNSDLLVLQKISDHLTNNPLEVLYIYGHAWDEGNSQANILLSEKRTLEVERFLVIHGIKTERIHRLFYGDSRPLKHGLNLDDKKLQRRIEYKIVNQ